MTVDVPGPSGPNVHLNVYLIAVQDYVVAQDLAGAIRDFDPAAQVLTARSCYAAMVAVTAVPQLALAFVEAGPDAVGQARLDVAIRDRGGTLVLLGDEAEAQHDGRDGALTPWPVMMRPFSGRTVMDFLIAARRNRSVAVSTLR